MLEMAYVCRKYLKYLRNGYNMFGNDLNGLKMWKIYEMAKIFWKWLRYMGHGLSV